MSRIVVLDYGSGNLRSAERALRRVGAEVSVTADRRAARRRTAHTLWYREDRSLRRLLDVLVVDLRYTLSTFKFGRAGLNR